MGAPVGSMRNARLHKAQAISAPMDDSPRPIVRNPERSSDTKKEDPRRLEGPQGRTTQTLSPARSTEDSLSRRTIPAHPMGIIQKRPRGIAHPWSNPADWYEAKWERIRLAEAWLDLVAAMVEEERLCR